MFYIRTKEMENLNDYKESVILVKDGWDDWFKYETQYFMLYVTSEGNEIEIGHVKIGQKGMIVGQRTPNLPKKFQCLTNDFFSLGQSETYYENIKQLGHDIRQFILKGIKDIAYNEKLYQEVKNEDVTKVSLMREITYFMVKNQFSRMARGHAKLTKYKIEYTYPTIEGVDSAKLEFEVKPDSNPPTNIHVIIGRNNVGKTYLIKNIISAIYNKEKDSKYGILHATSSDRRRSLVKQVFANVLCVSFSPFDDYSNIQEDVSNRKDMPFTYIGIKQLSYDYCDETESERLKLYTNFLPEILCNNFCNGLNDIRKSRRKIEMLELVMTVLESDPIFSQSELKNLIPGKSRDEDLIKSAKSVFKKLSSGHQVVMLTLVQLISFLTERTFVILDEPENHLHPPLLSSFIRALSDLLIKYNGVALVATHSPVILQEVPRRCVWKINRNGNIVTTNRLDIETFGATIGSLTREVFKLEVQKSGFHKLLLDNVEKGYDYDEIVEIFNHELGDEALSILRTLLVLKESDEL